MTGALMASFSDDIDGGDEPSSIIINHELAMMKHD